jgi:AcrR family transcriptional regulator
MTEPGDQRRATAAARAAQLATTHGLDGISLGALAGDLDMSKSGLAGLFGSKEGLQVAAVDSAADLFHRKVLDIGGEPGVDRLRNLLLGWIDYFNEFEGGCFLMTAAPAYAGRAGPVGTAVDRVLRASVQELRNEIRLAQRLGEIDPEADVTDISFELHAYVSEANVTRQLFDDPKHRARAEAAIDRALARLRPVDEG